MVLDCCPKPTIALASSGSLNWANDLSDAKYGTGKRDCTQNGESHLASKQIVPVVDLCEILQPWLTRYKFAHSPVQQSNAMEGKTVH
jgi:hypothetical protein